MEHERVELRLRTEGVASQATLAGCACRWAQLRFYSYHMAKNARLQHCGRPRHKQRAAKRRSTQPSIQDSKAFECEQSMSIYLRKKEKLHLWHVFCFQEGIARVAAWTGRSLCQSRGCSSTWSAKMIYQRGEGIVLACTEPRFVLTQDGAIRSICKPKRL